MGGISYGIGSLCLFLISCTFSISFWYVLRTSAFLIVWPFQNEIWCLYPVLIYFLFDLRNQTPYISWTISVHRHADMHYKELYVYIYIFYCQLDKFCCFSMFSWALYEVNSSFTKFSWSQNMRIWIFRRAFFFCGTRKQSMKYVLHIFKINYVWIILKKH